MANDCGGNHEGPCETIGDALLRACLTGDKRLLFDVLSTFETEELPALAEAAVLFASGVMAMMDVRSDGPVTTAIRAGADPALGELIKSLEDLAGDDPAIAGLLTLLAGNDDPEGC
jgi:hypothetical protein